MVLRCCFSTGYLVPGLEATSHEGAILWGFETMSSWPKVIGNKSKGGKKALRVSGGFKATHGSFSLSRGLVRVFGSIVQSFVLSMLDSWHDLFLCGSIALQFVSDDHTGNVLEAFEQFAEELLCRFLVSSVLDEDIQHISMLVHCSPQIMLLPVDFQEYFIEMPCVSWFGTTFFQRIGISLAEF